MSARAVAPLRGADRGSLAAVAVIAAALAAVVADTATGASVRSVPPIALMVVTATVFGRRLVTWRGMLATIVLVVMFIPMRLYRLPASLPFHLEPYRVVVLLTAVAWVTSALIDPNVKLRRTVLDRPLMLFAAAVVISLALNAGRFSSVQPDVLKKLAFFATFFLVTYLVSSTAGSLRDVDFLVRVLACSGTVVAAAALVESRTGYNVFNHLRSIVPFLKQDVAPPVFARGARLRVYASAQHPIALSAALVMIVPFAAYCALTRRRIWWWIALVVMLLGALATVSRTAVIMIVATLAVFAWLRPRETQRMWPALVPLLIVVHIALPGAIGSFREAFFPQGGLIAQQQNANIGSGRLATLGPVLHSEFKEPMFGEGFATRVTQPDEYVAVANAPILDDQWLGVLLETGLVGTFALAWLFVRAVRSFGREAKTDLTPRGWLLGAAAASSAAFFVSMFTYDAFSFVQVSFVFFIVLGIGAAALRSKPGTPVARW
jgi:O-antigen ligase